MEIPRGKIYYTDRNPIYFSKGEIYFREKDIYIPNSTTTCMLGIISFKHIEEKIEKYLSDGEDVIIHEEIFDNNIDMLRIATYSHKLFHNYIFKLPNIYLQLDRVNDLDNICLKTMTYGYKSDIHKNDDSLIELDVYLDGSELLTNMNMRVILEDEDIELNFSNINLKDIKAIKENIFRIKFRCTFFSLKHLL